MLLFPENQLFFLERENVLGKKSSSLQLAAAACVHNRMCLMGSASGIHYIKHLGDVGIVLFLLNWHHVPPYVSVLFTCGTSMVFANQDEVDASQLYF